MPERGKPRGRAIPALPLVVHVERQRRTGGVDLVGEVDHLPLLLPNLLLQLQLARGPSVGALAL